MVKYRKKPVEVEAMRWMPDDLTHTGTLIGWLEAYSVDFDVYSDDEYYLSIGTLEGTMQASPGDWIIKGIKGEFYPCKNDIFEASYDAA